MSLKIHDWTITGEVCLMFVDALEAVVCVPLS